MALTVIESEIAAAKKAGQRDRVKLLAELRDIADRVHRLTEREPGLVGLLLDVLPRVPVRPGSGSA